MGARSARRRVTGPYQINWGPISDDYAQIVCGSAYGATSILLRLDDVQPLANLVQAARTVIPEHVYPLDEDTPETLAARLGESDWLDDSTSLPDRTAPPLASCLMFAFDRVLRIVHLPKDMKGKGEGGREARAAGTDRCAPDAPTGDDSTHSTHCLDHGGTGASS